MSTQTRDKLKMMLGTVPPGFLVTASWLADQGVAYATFRDYVRRGWLERVARGVFRRPTTAGVTPETLDWQSCVLSIQHILECELHVGAMTALGLHGYNHYVRLGGSPVVWLYGDHVPNWLSKLQLNARLETRKLSLFKDATLGVVSHSYSETESDPRAVGGEWTLTSSSAERAILESLNEVPKHLSFDQVDKSFESLVNLRPRLLAQLLQSCGRIKAKRLFFIFADRHGHAWRKYVNPDDFDLGRGDRALVKGGALHPKYRIVVPAEYVPAERNR